MRSALAALMAASCLLAATGQPHENGRFTVSERDGAWWFITPDGRRMVSLGVNHVAPIYLLAPYNRAATLQRYGSDFVRGPSGAVTAPAEGVGFAAIRKLARDFHPFGRAARVWMRQVLADLQDWGFNSLGFGTAVPRMLYREALPYVLSLRVAGVAFYLEQERELPDVFSEAFARRVEAAIRPIARDARDDPNLLGYGFSDLPPWSDAGDNAWLEAIRSLPAEAEGKGAWIGLLRGRYRTAAAAARTYGVKAVSWADLRSVTRWTRPLAPDRAAADGRAFLARMAERWYGLHAESIRRHDPSHLIFGDKLHGKEGIADSVLRVIGRYVDVLTVEWFGSFAEQREALRRMHGVTGKPVLLGDGSFSSRRPNQEWARGAVVGSLEEAGRRYASYLEAAMSEPHIVGWHHCGYMEGWKGLPHPLLASQGGFKDPFDRVHEDLIRWVRPANRQAHVWHAGAGK